MSWASANLNQILLTHDSGVWGPEDPAGGVSVLRSTNMRNDGTIDFANLALRAVPSDKRKAKLLQTGDIILENSGGGPKQPVGRVCFFAGDHRDHVAGNFCRRLRANHNLVLPRFLFWRLFYLHSVGETGRFQTQTTGIRNLQFRLYAQQEIELPSISEQRRIIEILDQADALRKRAREADVKAARILPALFLKMFGDPATNPMGWPTTDFFGVFDDVTAGHTKVQARDFQPSGAVPIVDQGQDYIAGYTDDKSIAHMDPLPVIVFGDHTRTFKYVDFPFVLGADGVRVLSAKDGINPLFAYWNCRMLEIPSAGYSRHFKYLKEKRFMYPAANRQSDFARAASETTKLTAAIGTATTKAERLFTLFLQRAFSGQLTAKWRAAHIQELLVEMQEQARLLNLPVPAKAAN